MCISTFKQPNIHSRPAKCLSHLSFCQNSTNAESCICNLACNLKLQMNHRTGMLSSGEACPTHRMLHDYQNFASAYPPFNQSSSTPHVWLSRFQKQTMQERVSIYPDASSRQFCRVAPSSDVYPEWHHTFIKLKLSTTDPDKQQHRQYTFCHVTDGSQDSRLDDTFISESMCTGTLRTTEILHTSGDSDHAPMMTQIPLTCTRFLKPGTDPTLCRENAA